MTLWVSIEYSPVRVPACSSSIPENDTSMPGTPATVPVPSAVTEPSSPSVPETSTQAPPPLSVKVRSAACARAADAAADATAPPAEGAGTHDHALTSPDSNPSSKMGLGVASNVSVLLNVPLTPFSVAVMVTIPERKAVTRPVSSTLAFSGSDDDHTRFGAGSAEPPESSTVADSWMVSPAVTFSDGDEISMSAAACATVTVAVPSATAVTSPLESTVAMAIDELA